MKPRGWCDEELFQTIVQGVIGAGGFPQIHSSHP
jgi:hypothetical protein